MATPSIALNSKPAAKERFSPACMSARGRLSSFCWNVAELATKQNQAVELEHQAALESLRGLRSDLRELRDADLYTKRYMKLRTWYLIEGTKLFLLALSSFMGLALTVYQIASEVTNMNGKAAKIVSIVLSASMTSILAIITFAQGGFDFHEGFQKIKDEKQQRKEKRFIATMDNILQNIEWLLQEKKSNSTNCHKYIAQCHRYLQALPKGYVEEHLEMRTLIANLVKLLPDNDELKRTLTDLGSTIKGKEKAHSAPAATFLHIDQADRGTMLMHESTLLDIQPKPTSVPVAQRALWEKLEMLLGGGVDNITWDGLELLRPLPDGAIGIPLPKS